MSPRSRFHRRLGLAAAALATLALAWPGAAEAGNKRRSKKKKPPITYYFELTDVKLAKGIPPEVKDLVKKEYLAAVEKHPRLLHKLDPAAPDRNKEPIKFRRYLKANRLKAFLVGVEVKEYNYEVETLEAPRRGKRVGARVGIHTFGETLPGRTIAFVGDGAATVKLDVGKRVRKRDTFIANRDAAAQAVLNALDESIKKLALKGKVSPKKKKRRRRRKK